MPETNDVISHLYYDLNDKIDSLEQRLAGAEDIYYTNSYVERLKALGSNVQYSTHRDISAAMHSLVDGTLTLSSLYISKSSIINGVGWIQGQSGQGNYTADNYNGVGLYSYDLLNEKLVLIANSADDGNIWKAVANTYSTKDFTTPVTINKGIYYIGALWNHSAVVSIPTIVGVNTFVVSSTSINSASISSGYLTGTLAAQNTLPAEILNSSITNAVQNHYWYLY